MKDIINSFISFQKLDKNTFNFSIDENKINKEITIEDLIDIKRIKKINC